LFANQFAELYKADPLMVSFEEHNVISEKCKAIFSLKSVTFWQCYKQFSVQRRTKKLDGKFMLWIQRNTCDVKKFYSTSWRRSINNWWVGVDTD
jgi:hypothetical protein